MLPKNTTFFLANDKIFRSAGLSLKNLNSCKKKKKEKAVLKGRRNVTSWLPTAQLLPFFKQTILFLCSVVFFILRNAFYFSAFRKLELFPLPVPHHPLLTPIGFHWENEGILRKIVFFFSFFSFPVACNLWANIFE